MPFTLLSKPSNGDTGRKTLIDGVIDDLAFLYGVYSSLHSVSVPNGSFELDVDGGGEPDEWVTTLFTGGSRTIDTSAGNFLHGGKALKFVHPGGGGNGGGYVTSADFFEWDEKTALVLQWSHKVSAATMRDKVDVHFYDSAQTLISTSSLYTSITNPTSWTVQMSQPITPPANTRYAKIKITGGDSSVNVAGSSWWDNVRLIPHPITFTNQYIFDTAGTFNWTCPADVKLVYVEVFGGGAGGGGSDASNGGGGGGAGGYANDYPAFTVGSTYAITVGAKGAAGASNAVGSAGTASNFNAAVIGNGGAGGASGGTGGAGGAGGTASGGDVNTNGSAGSNRSGANGGAGGANASIGIATQATAAGAGAAAPYYGAGGAGGHTVTQAGGDGGSGAVIIRWIV